MIWQIEEVEKTHFMPPAPSGPSEDDKYTTVEYHVYERTVNDYGEPRLVRQKAFFDLEDVFNFMKRTRQF
jgi:hypothetical protein